MKKNIFILVSTSLLSLLLLGCEKDISSTLNTKDETEIFTSWEPTIIEEEIDLEGLTKEYTLLFLTDTHMIINDTADSQQVKDNALPRYDSFRNSEGIPSADQFDEWMTYANTYDLDGVLLGGDIIDFPSAANISYFDEQLNTLEVPYLYTLGNHDWTYPWDYMTESGKETYLPMLNSYLNENPAIHTLDFEEFVIVAVDNSSNQFNADALSEFESILSEGRPTIVLLHVPLITQSVLGRAKEIWGEGNGVVLGAGNYGGIYPNETSTKFMNMISGEGSPVELVLAGHVHFYDKDYIDGVEPVLQIVGDAGFHGSAIKLHIK